MTTAARELLERALQLPAAERADVAEALLASLPAPDPAVGQAWAQELGRRVRHALETGERGRPVEEVMAELRQKHGIA